MIGRIYNLQTMTNVQRKVLVACENCYLHRLCLRTIKLVGYGDLKALAVQGQELTVFLQIQDFHLEIQNEARFLRFQSEKITTYYVLDGNTGLFAFTLDTDNLQIINLEKTLEMAGILFVDVADVDKHPGDKNWLEQHWPAFASEQLVTASKVNRALAKGGNYLQRKLGVLEQKAVDRIRTITESAIEKSGKNRVLIGDRPDEESRGWFSKIKKGASLLYEKSSWAISEVFDPIINSAHKVSNKVCASIDNSDRPFLKKTKEFLAVSEASLRNTFEGVKDITKVIGTELYQNGKDVIQARMQPQAALATEVALNTQSDSVSSPAQRSDMPICPRPQEVLPKLSGLDSQIGQRVDQIPFPKLQDLSLHPYSQVQVQQSQIATEPCQPGLSKDTIRLQELALDESVIQQV